MSTVTAARAKIAAWRHDPIAFVREAFGVEPDAWQASALQKIANGKRLAMKACKGPGKTAVLAWIAWWFLLTRPFANVAATSISGDNLQDGLWKEMAKWQAKSPLLSAAFEWQKTRIVAKDHVAIWWASARQWSKTADAQKQADTLAGLHADNMLFIIDEAGGVPRAVAATAEAALASGTDTKLIIAGNPTHTDGPLYDACVTHRHLWDVIEITGDPNDPMRSPRISVEWAKQQIEMYGRDNPWVLVNVFGKFPPGSINALLGPEEVTAAIKRHLQPQDYQFAQKRLGVDVARFGDDRTVIFARQGLNAQVGSNNPVIMRNARTDQIAARIMLSKQRWGSELDLIDDTGGWGHGTVDQLIAAGHAPIAVQYHAPAIDPRYANRRAEMWMEMATWIRRGGALPDIPELIGELTTPTYVFVNGKFQLEDKKLVKDRLGRSPDLADALALTFALPEMPTQGHLPRGLGAQPAFVQHDYDPFAGSAA